MIGEEQTGLFDALPEHEFDERDFCIHCGVPWFAVVDGIIIKGCGVRRSKELDCEQAVPAPQPVHR